MLLLWLEKRPINYIFVRRNNVTRVDSYLIHVQHISRLVFYKLHLFSVFVPSCKHGLVYPLIYRGQYTVNNLVFHAGRVKWMWRDI